MRLHELNQLGNTEVSQEYVGNSTNWVNIESGLFSELADHFRWIRRMIKPSDFYREPKVAEGFNRIIKKYTGINIVLGSDFDEFAIYNPDINSNNILYDLAEKNYYKNRDVMRNGGELKSLIDLKNYKISGDLSRIPIRLFVSPTLIYYEELGFSDKELAAMTLHEVGHAFTLMSASVYTYSAIVPMLGMMNRVFKTNTSEELTVVLKEWNNEPNTLTKLDIKELENKSKEVIVTAIVSNHVRDSRSIAKHGEYEMVNSEYLADKFATRYGAGSYVVKGLDRINALVGNRSKLSGIEFAIREALVAILGIAKTALAYVGGGPVLAAIAAVGYISSLYFVEFSNVSDGTYDTEVNRFKRIREDMIAMLKDKKIDRAIGDRIRLDIKKIDDILKTYNEYKSIYGRVIDFVLPSKRRIGAQTEFYRQLESLGNNDLFVQAYDLRNL